MLSEQRQKIDTQFRLQKLGNNQLRVTTKSLQNENVISHDYDGVKEFVCVYNHNADTWSVSVVSMLTDDASVILRVDGSMMVDRRKYDNLKTWVQGCNWGWIYMQINDA